LAICRTSSVDIGRQLFMIVRLQSSGDNNAVVSTVILSFLRYDERVNSKMNVEYQNFDRTMTELMKVPHSEIKAKLEAEKRAKQRKKRKPKTPASDRASGGKD